MFLSTCSSYNWSHSARKGKQGHNSLIGPYIKPYSILEVSIIQGLPLHQKQEIHKNSENNE